MLPKNIRNQIAEWIIHKITPVGIILCLLIGIAVILIAPEQVFRLVPIAIGLVTLTPAWIMARAGKPLSGTPFFLLFLLLTVITGTILNGGVRAPVFVGILPVITIVFCLYGRKTAYILSAFLLIFGGICVILESKQMLPYAPQPPAALVLASYALMISFTLLFISVPIRMLFYALETSEKQRLSVEEAIAKRELVQKKLQKSELFRMKFFESSLIPIIVMDYATNTFLDCNPAAASIYRFSSIAETIGKTPLDVSAPIQYDDTPSPQKVSYYSKKAITEGMVVFDWKHQRPDGEIWDAEVHLMSFKTDNHQLLQMILIDITDRKRAEEELQKLAAVVKYSSNMVNLATPEGKMIFLNASGCKMLGIDPDEVERENIMEIIPDHQKELVQIELLPTLKQGNTWGGELQYRNLKTGNLIDVHAKTFPIHDPKTGKLLFLANVSMDITDRKIAEQDKEKMATQLVQAQKMEAIGTLAGGIAHDFNNILAAIIGYTELSKMMISKENKVSEYLSDILEAGKRATDLVQQILTFSRQTEQELKPVSVKAIVKEALKLLRASLPSTIDITQNIRSDSLVMSDPTQIHQILINLCTNASHAMRKKGGTLAVSLTNVEIDGGSTSHYQGLESGPYINLEISDNGHGMPPGVMERIFEPFFTTKERGEGTGMGLAVIHGIVKSYGGAIYVESETGKGSVFKTFLPVCESSFQAENGIEMVLPQGTERILLIDDEPALVEIGKAVLESLGYQVTTRTSSIEALNLIQARPRRFDLVITDLTMPQMPGDKLAAEIIAKHKNIPVILCTGFNNLLTDEKAKEIGVKGFLMKPIVRSEMALMVHKVLDEAKGAV